MGTCHNKGSRTYSTKGRNATGDGLSGKQTPDLYKGLYVEGSPGEHQQKADFVVSGVRDVLADFGFDDELRAVYFSPTGTTRRGEADASMNGVGDLKISTKALSRGELNSDGYFISDTFYGTGAHEGGHALVNALLKNSVTINPDNKSKTTARANLERAAARRKGKLETAIIKEAKKRYGSNPPISRYGSKNNIEKIAEAVADYYANKSNAKPYSKTIVKVMKDIKSGKYKPKISVSEREMYGR